MATCREEGCGAMILWVETPTGKRMPIDWRRVAGGNVDVDGEKATIVTPDPTVARYVSHYTTCRPVLARRAAEKAAAARAKEAQQKKQLGLFR